MTRIHVYDRDEDELALSVRQLGYAFASATGAPFEIPTTHQHRTRWSLMQAVAATDEDHPIVALIDLQENDRRFAMGGIRVIDALTHHPRLRARCHPVAFTQFASQPEALRLRGARAVVSKHDLDVAGPEQRQEVKRTLLEMTSTSVAQDIPFAVLPGNERAAQRHAQAVVEAEAAARAWLAPEASRAYLALEEPWFWSAVRALALTGEPRTAARWVLLDHPGLASDKDPTRPIEDRIQKLAHFVPARFRSYGVDWRAAASDLLDRAPAVVAQPSLSGWRDLPDLSVAGRWLTDRVVRERSMLDPDSLDSVDRVVGNIRRRRGNESLASVNDGVRLALRSLEGDYDVEAFEREVLRGLWALHDTYLELQEEARADGP